MSGNWIVVFKKDTPKETLDAVVAQIESGGGSIKHKWYTSAKPVLYGFAGAIPDSVFEEVKKHPNLDFFEADSEVQLAK